MVAMDPQPPIAGWYPDPENEAGDRWWNGSSWSDHRRARDAGAGWGPVAPYSNYYTPRAPMANVPALAGMITSLSALLFNFILFGLPGLVGGCISIYGLVKANQLAKAGMTTGNGRGFAVAGIITGFSGALLWDLFYFTVIQPLSHS
jgi:hypothetical protein